MRAALLILVLCGLLAVEAVPLNLRFWRTGGIMQSVQGGAGQHSLLKAMTFTQTLRVCNAYPSNATLTVYHNTEEITANHSLAYKRCRDFSVTLEAGDKIEFRIPGHDVNAGTFAVNEVPNRDAVLLLVVYKHSATSSAVSFESHVYANLLNAQLAVLDVYKGPATGELHIQDHPESDTSRSEALRFDSVVAINPGHYRMALLNEHGVVQASANLTANNKGSYVVLRVGGKSPEGPVLPQELVVYPSGAWARAAFSSVLGAALLVLAAVVA